MAMWKNDDEMFALMKEKLYTPVVGDILDQMGYKHQDVYKRQSFGSVVLCAGNPKWEQHARIVQGFEDYMQWNGAQNRIYLDNSCCIGSEAQRNILNRLEKPDVAACCSVLSQGSVMLVQGLQQCGKAGNCLLYTSRCV